MSRFDYTAPAELFVGPMSYRRFPTSAEAIKYAVETLENVALLSAALVVGEDRFEGVEIRALYEGKLFPLSRAK